MNKFNIVFSSRYPVVTACDVQLAVLRGGIEIGRVTNSFAPGQSSAIREFTDAIGDVSSQYSFVEIANSCKCVSVEDQARSVPTPATINCNGTVSTNVKFLSSSVNANQSVQLRITITNTNSSEVTYQLGAVTLPAGLSGAISIPAVGIPGNTQRTFLFTLTGINANTAASQVNLEIPSGQGSYLCGSQQFSAGGGTDNLTVYGAAGNTNNACDLRVESFEFTPSSAQPGQVVQLCVRLKNYGSANLTSVAVPPIAVPAGFTGTPLTLAAVPLAVGGVVQACTSLTVAANAGTGVQSVTIPSGVISANCGQVIGNVRADLQVNSGSGSGAGGCSGSLIIDYPTLVFNTNQGGGPGVTTPTIMTMAGGVPSTTYTADFYPLGGTALITSATFTTDASGNATLSALANYPGSTEVIVRGPNGCSFTKIGQMGYYIVYPSPQP